MYNGYEHVKVPHRPASSPITPDRITFTTITRTDIVRHTIGELDDDCEYLVYVDGVPAGRAATKCDLAAIYTRLLQGTQETGANGSEQPSGGETSPDSANAINSAGGNASAKSDATSSSHANNAVIVIVPREDRSGDDHEHPLCPYNLPGRVGLAGLVVGSCALTAMLCTAARKASVPPEEDFAYVDTRR